MWPQLTSSTVGLTQDCNKPQPIVSRTWILIPVTHTGTQCTVGAMIKVYSFNAHLRPLLLGQHQNNVHFGFISATVYLKVWSNSLHLHSLRRIHILWSKETWGRRHWRAMEGVCVHASWWEILDKGWQKPQKWVIFKQNACMARAD